MKNKKTENQNIKRNDRVRYKPYVFDNFKKTETKKQRENRLFLMSSRWRRLRNVKIQNDPLCEACKDNGIIIPGKYIHHIKPRDLFPELKLTYENLETLCWDCHTKVTKLHKRKFKTKEDFDAYYSKHWD